jgi:glycosyltransferase involved in cell wall biosynthesis
VSRTQSDGKELKRRYGIPPEHVVIGSLGFASSAKRVQTILRAVSALNRRDLVYVMVGNVGDGIQQVLRNYGLSELVRITGHVDRKTFLDYCNLIDIGIDIRYPTMGETSASVCRILGAGKPCIVSDLGWFSEIPSDCVVKLDPTADECALAERLRDLMASDVLRQEIGDNARRYVLEFHSPRKAADKYLRFLDEVREAQRESSVERTIIRDTSRSMADIGVTDSDAWFIDDVARHLATLLNTR